MPKDWIRIRRARADITDYLIHWTHGRASEGQVKQPLDVLKEILGCGYLQASFAIKGSITGGSRNATIKGDRPAVCFTEQPLDAFLKSCAILPSRCKPYGLAVHKWHLYNYGGRPVVYGHESLLSRLNDADQYLWVRYSPIPDATFAGYPIDWTHEREWRSVVHKHDYPEIGKTPIEGIPLLLPPATYPKSDKPVLALPRILVATEDERGSLIEWIEGIPSYEGDSGVLSYYFSILSKAMVIPLDRVGERIASGDTRYARLETLPYEELDPSFATPTPEAYL